MAASNSKKAPAKSDPNSFGAKVRLLFAGNNGYTLRKPMRQWWWLFMAPVTIAFCIGFVWPFIQGIYLSFCEFRALDDVKPIGVGNYIKVFNDKGFLHSFGLTALFAVTSLVIINILAFAVALALTSSMKGSNIFRTVFFMPNLIGGVVLGYIWTMIFDGILVNTPVNSIVNDPNWGFWGLIIIVCWQQIGYMMIIYIAGLNAIPGDLYEAARIDGATGWQILWNVIIPNVMPSITICMFLSLTNGFKLFDQNLALTNGLPKEIADGAVVSQSELLALNIVHTFKNTPGVAQAKGVLFFILVAALGLAQLGITRKREVQQ